MRNRYGETAWSPGLLAWSGARQNLALGLSQALVAPLAWRRPSGLGVCVPATALAPLLTVLNRVLQSFSQNQLFRRGPGRGLLGAGLTWYSPAGSCGLS